MVYIKAGRPLWWD